MIEERKCKGPCGKWKPLSDFGKDPTMRGGVRNTCRACANARNREYKLGCRRGRPKSPCRTTLDAREKLALELLGYMQTYWNVVVNEQPMWSIR